MCLKRKDDHFVPLVAVDELPSWIMLKGVPMTLRGEEVLKLGLMNCGDCPKTNDDYYQVEFNGIPADIHPCNTLADSEAGESSTSQHSSTTSGKVFMAPDKNGGGSKTSSGSIEKEKAHINDIQVFPLQSESMCNPYLEQAKIAGFKMHSRVSAANQGAPGTFGKKVYCTFWCRTGNCNFTQQGCKFLHEIPQDQDTRLAIGIRDYPTWMQEDPTPPKSLKASSVDRMQEATWRRGMTQDNRRVLPASPTPGHGRTLSHIATSVPYSGRVQTSSLIQAPTMTPTITGGQCSDSRVPNLHKLQAAQQAALFLPAQQYFPSSTDSVTHTRPQMQPNTFDGADGNTSFQSITSAGQETFRFQYPTNEVFNNATVVGTNERRPVPATQPPISRPGVSSQALRTSLKGKDPTNPTIYTPRQNPADAIPQATAPAGSNTITSTHAMTANQKASSTNGSVRSTSRAHTPARSGINNAAGGGGGGGGDQTLSSLVDGSTASPPIMHRRMFVAPGEPQYLPNPIDAGLCKSRQRSGSKKGANAKGRGYGAGKTGQSAKAQGQGSEWEDLVVV